MDPKEAETQKKIKILAVYIRKQLAAGVAPQELYKDLITRKVPHKLAVKMINQSLAQADRTASQSTAQPEAQTARLEELRTLINTQADAGKTVNEIRNQLVEKKVAPEEAAVLILEVTGLAVQPLNDRPHVSPFLPNGSSPAVIPALENQKEMQAYIHTQLSAGVGLKVLVDALIQHGMDRNQAINLVMDLNQKREAELRETAPSPAGELKANPRKRGLRSMLIGGGIFLAGLCLTLVVLVSGGNKFLYWLGALPLIFGLIYAVTGLIQSLQNR